MAYRFYLGDELLPVTPAQLTIRTVNQNKTITLINDGEVNVLKNPGLSDISFDMLIPQQQYSFANETKPAGYYLELLERLKVEKKPFQFIVSRVSPNGVLLFDTDISVSLEEYDIKEDKSSNGMDVVASVSLKQYREFGTRTIQLQKSATGKATATQSKPREQTNKPAAQSHTVVSGDTLWAIAKRYLGDGARYGELAKLNGIANPNLIRVGQVIRLA
jgi:nucleoid-associated protein YgaU